jgi:hypothetical protein
MGRKLAVRGLFAAPLRYVAETRKKLKEKKKKTDGKNKAV